MPNLQPIYTADNVRIAYQLLWSLSVFWRKPPFTEDWLQELNLIAEADGVRILEHRFATPTTSLFLLSTRPECVPQEIPRAIKGRLQYLVRAQFPKAFQRNYDLHSIGSTTREKAEAYVASQLLHHHADDVKVRGMLSDLQFVNPEVDLRQPRFSAHARHRVSLHLVLVHGWRRPECNLEVWKHVRAVLRNSSDQKGWMLSRLGLLPDHIHLTLGTPPAISPLDVGLSCMNNVAFAHDMQPVLMHGCFLGTLGEYDLGAVKNETHPR